jgi:GNAT superfamily N-acetyltransferase
MRLLLAEASDIRTATLCPNDLPDRPLAELWNPATPEIDDDAPDAGEVVARLSHVGLSDAYSWARKPHELSEGQRHRAALASAIWQDVDAVVGDDWLAPLDRLTAQAVAWRTGRVLDDLGVGGCFATTRDDLGSHLRPDKHIRFGWEPDPQIIVGGYQRSSPPVTDPIQYERGSMRDWHSLRHLHYQTKHPGAVRTVHKLTHPDLDHPAAVAVLAYPDQHCAARRAVTGDAYSPISDRAKYHRLNQEVARLSRIVVTPELRGLGLAKQLIESIAWHEPLAWLECSAAMSRHHAFLLNADFMQVPQPETPILKRWRQWCEATGMHRVAPASGTELAGAIKDLSVRQQKEGKAVIWRLYHRAVLHRRNGSKSPKRVPNPADSRWWEAYEYAAQRTYAGPIYWIRDCRSPTPHSHRTGTVGSTLAGIDYAPVRSRALIV